MICNAYAAAVVGPANEIKIARMMRDLVKREKHVAAMPHITPNFAGKRMGRPPNQYRDKAIAHLRQNGPMTSAEIAARLGISAGMVSDALVSAKRFGQASCVGRTWSLT